jgi:hypothetical protein
MARLYRPHVLTEPAPQEVGGIQIQGLKKEKSDEKEPAVTH